MKLSLPTLLCALVASLATAVPLAAQVPCFESNFGTDLGLGDDLVAANLPLGFTFPFGTNSVTTVSVSANGFVWLGNSTDAGCCDGDVTAFLAGLPRIAAVWADLDPSSTGAVYFNTFPGRAVVTWNQVPEYGGVTPFTFQLQLLSNGAFVLFWDQAVAVAAHTTLVGITPGGGVADPGALDFSVAMPFDSGTVGTVYEQFLANSFDLRGRVIDFVPNGQGGYRVTARTGCQFASFQQYGPGCPATSPVVLNSGQRPTLGTSFDMFFGDAPVGSLAAMLLLGGTETSAPLDAVGMTGCSLLVLPSLVFPTPVQGRYSVVSLPIPNDPTLVGGVLFAQVVLLAPGANPAGLVSSSGGRIEIGT